MGLIQFQIAISYTQQPDTGMYYQQQADGKGDATRKTLRLSVGNREGFPITDALRMHLILSAVSTATQHFVCNKDIFYSFGH